MQKKPYATVINFDDFSYVSIQQYLHKLSVMETHTTKGLCWCKYNDENHRNGTIEHNAHLLAHESDFFYLT